MRVTCSLCGAQCRVLQVDEGAPEGVVITYTCANPRCTNYGGEAAQRVLPREEENNG